jgi:hypothetical protein
MNGQAVEYRPVTDFPNYRVGSDGTEAFPVARGVALKFDFNGDRWGLIGNRERRKLLSLTLTVERFGTDWDGLKLNSPSRNRTYILGLEDRCSVH